MKCGDCTLCCDVLPIGEIEKPESVLCGHCILKKGCNIYKDRPEACKNFDCMYIESDDMKIELRPDNCNVIFEKVTDNICLAISHYNEPNAFEKPIVLEYIKELNDKGFSVISTSFTHKPKEIFLTEGHTKEYVWGEAMKEYNKQN